MTLAIGDPLPHLTLPDATGKPIRLGLTPGHTLVVYFYPKDNTPGCTREAQGFAQLHAEFQRAGVDVIGISRDSSASHERFAAKYGLPFTLLSDSDEIACKAFDVIHEKTNYGRKYLGVVRSTFLFDSGGRLARAWRGVKVKDHATAVLEAARSLQAT